VKLIILLSLTFNAFSKTVVVIDAPVDYHSLPENIQKNVKGVYNFVGPNKILDNCREVGEELEQFLSLGLECKTGEFKKLKLTESFEEFTNQIHGYHTLNLIANEAPGDFYHIGVAKAFDTNDIKNFQSSIKKLKKEFLFINNKIKMIKPDIINYSGSESFDENYRDILSFGYSNDKAFKLAQIIMTLHENFFSNLIKKNPKTQFVVSAGNGGADWKGDDISDLKNRNLWAIPAALKYKNIISVGSKNQTGISIFSNFGKIVKVYEAGEKVPSKIPCLNRPLLNLTGTSQAAALYTHQLLTTP
jgi:hypothetical protein